MNNKRKEAKASRASSRRISNREINKIFKAARDSERLERKFQIKGGSRHLADMASSQMSITSYRVVQLFLDAKGGFRNWTRSLSDTPAQRRALTKAIKLLMRSPVIGEVPVEYVHRVRQLLSLCVQTSWGSTCLVYGCPVVCTWMCRFKGEPMSMQLDLVKPDVRNDGAVRVELHLYEDDARDMTRRDTKGRSSEPITWAGRYNVPWSMTSGAYQVVENKVQPVWYQHGDIMHPAIISDPQILELAALLQVLHALGQEGLIDAPLSPMGKKGFLEFSARFTGGPVVKADHRSYKRLLTRDGQRVSDEMRQVWLHKLAMQHAGEGGVVFSDQDRRSVDDLGIRDFQEEIYTGLAKASRIEMAKSERPVGSQHGFDCTAIGWTPKGFEVPGCVLRSREALKHVEIARQMGKEPDPMWKDGWFKGIFPDWIVDQHTNEFDCEFDKRVRAALEEGNYFFRLEPRRKRTLAPDLTRDGRPTLIMDYHDGKFVQPMRWHWCGTCARTGQYRRWKMEKAHNELYAPTSYVDDEGRTQIVSPFRRTVANDHCLVCGNRVWRIALYVYLDIVQFEDILNATPLARVGDRLAKARDIRFMMFGNIVDEAIKWYPGLKVGENYRDGMPWHYRRARLIQPPRQKRQVLPVKSRWKLN